ncbi:MAG TPA: periplasmic heavy metal sensor [Candidatus Binatia bacterium]|nr:periplasmic heavy metal sensor [Candidatus Binatia bacterium]
MTKTVKIVFLASLVLNLLLLGVIVGQVPRSLDARPTRQQQMEEALEKLPEPAQSRLREHFMQIRAAGDPVRRQIEEARGEALQLLSAEPFDQHAYDDQVTKIEELRIAMSKRMGQKIKELAKELSPDERRMLADVLRRPPASPK